jgi:hypothetical protein
MKTMTDPLSVQISDSLKDTFRTKPFSSMNGFVEKILMRKLESFRMAFIWIS